MKKHSIFLTILLTMGLYTPIVSSNQSTDFSTKKILASTAVIICAAWMPLVYVEGTNLYRHYQQRKTHSLSFEEEREKALNLDYKDDQNYKDLNEIEDVQELTSLTNARITKKTKILAHLTQLQQANPTNYWVPEITQTIQAMKYIDSQITNGKHTHTSRIIAASTPIDPNGELAKVCTKIRDDKSLGANPTDIRWLKKYFLRSHIPAFYDPNMKTIFLNPNITAQQMICTLPHEYQHHQQFYGNIQKILTPAEREHDADAAMASFITCHECLQHAANQTSGPET